MSLVLEDGTIFVGESFGAERSLSGECVFQTGMTGYVESLTDPSYRGQILVLSYPLIGNYGVPPETKDSNGLPLFFESSQIHVAGLIVADYSDHYSHWNAKSSLSEWLKSQNVPALSGVDTRELIKKLRDGGSTLAKLVTGNDKADSIPIVNSNSINLVAQVSCKEPKSLGDPSAHLKVLIVDFGMKINQLRCFLDRGISVTVVPWNYDFNKDIDKYHGLFLSNGPGDPEMCSEAVHHIQTFLKTQSDLSNPIPVFGICLGHQLLGLAVGAKTFKLKFGNRGQNQPCIDAETKRCHLTMQNHGFAIDTTTLPGEWREFFVNANDRTNEGIRHASKPFMSVQFHPEAKGGPKETEYLFDQFAHHMECHKKKDFSPFVHSLHCSFQCAEEPEMPTKVLILGSGGLSIGQAGEFDYSGSQAIKALKEEGIISVLINPNIATVQTTKGLADQVYFLPVTPEFVKKVIELENPDGLYLQFGGQTALNCAIALYREGYFAKKGVRILGTPVTAILATEDRELFSDKLKEINEKIAPSVAARSLQEALTAAREIGYPVIVRAGFALGGLGSGFANDDSELVSLATQAFASSEQILVEQSLKGWKEIEYEVVRDRLDNCVTVCNMENFDPLGIHTGESIVVAPSQTLSDRDYHSLRQVALRVVRHLGVIGECNIQFCLDPHSDTYYIIEVNARLSRSSALASKATGYPLAFVASKLALGKTLPELRNQATGNKTTACFEPSLDYVVVKMPRWDLKKFTHVKKIIGTSMKSVGEVMAIGRTFEEAIQKTIRMVSAGAANGFESNVVNADDHELQHASPSRIFVIADAFAKGYSVERIHELTKIDRWFLHKLKRISDHERKLSTIAPQELDYKLMQQRLGFSDNQIACCLKVTEPVVRAARKSMNILPVVRQIDTVSAEFPCTNNYLYMTYNGNVDDITCGEHPKGDPIIVLGSGAYSIGSSVEFDWCAVSCIRTLRKKHQTIVINFNPETVSTDYDESDKLYFEEISFERVADIYEKENSRGIVVSMGGQIANNISINLSRHNMKILGTTAESIDNAENRYKFSRMLDTLGVDQPQWKECRSFEDTQAFCHKVGYPCLVRPSFVLSGAGMIVVHTDGELENYLKTATKGQAEVAVVISKFITDAKEIDVDAVAQHGRIIASAISEHIENAGVHSGDATLVLPAQDLDDETVRRVKQATHQIAASLDVSGPINIQFIAKNNEIKVIECNLRASRSFPFVSKTLGVNFAEIATNALFEEPIEVIPISLESVSHVAVKVPQFSFGRLEGADPVLGVEMASTGEVACFGKTKYDAYVKGLLSTGFRLPPSGAKILLSLGSFKEKSEFLPSARKLAEMGFELYGTPGTADFMTESGVAVIALDWPNKEADLSDFSLQEHLASNKIQLSILFPSKNKYRRPSSFMSKGYIARRLAIDRGIPLITNIKVAKMFVECLRVVSPNIQVTATDCLTSRELITIRPFIDTSFQTIPSGEWSQRSIRACLSGCCVVLSDLPISPQMSQPTKRKEIGLTKAEAAVEGCTDYGFVLNVTKQPYDRQIASELCAISASVDEIESWFDSEDAQEDTWVHYLQTHNVPLCVSASKRDLSAVLFYAQLHCFSVFIMGVKTAFDFTIIRNAKEKLGSSVACQVYACDLFDETMGDLFWDNWDDIDVVSLNSNHSGDKTDSHYFINMLLNAVSSHQITIESLCEKLHDNPCRIFGIKPHSSNSLEVDINKGWVINDSNVRSAFQGKRGLGCIHRVSFRGEFLAVDGKAKLAAEHKPSQIVSKSSFEAEPEEVPRHSSVRPSSPLRQERKSAGIIRKTPSTPSKTLPLENRPSVEFTPSHFKPPAPTSLGLFHVLSIQQFNRQLLHHVFAVAEEMKAMTRRMGRLDILKDKVLATVFLEPSTRTSCSFAAAMFRLGGAVIPVTGESSSVVKGESLVDTIKTVEQYSDVIVLRHPGVGSAHQCAESLKKPIINAGDGSGEHPTQALLDTFTIRQELGTNNRLNVTLIGDLKYGRTVHSLVQALALYDEITLNYISPKELQLPRKLYEELNKLGVRQHEYTTNEDLMRVIEHTDVVYVTRIQKERFSDPNLYEAVKGRFCITPELMAKAKEKMCLLHPLPRNDEISVAVDSDPRAAYYRQMENGMYIRMALLAIVLGRA